MFFVIFCILFILFFFISRLIYAILFALAVLCNEVFTNETLKTSAYVICIIGGIGLIILCPVLAYNLTPDVLEYLK